MKAKTIIVMLFMLLFLVSHVFAISIGISPGRVKFDGVLRDGYAERDVVVSTNAGDILKGHFTVKGEIEGWLSFEPNSQNIALTKGDPYVLKIKVQPPGDMPTGNYSGTIEFVTDTLGDVPGRAGGVVKTAVSIIIDTEVTGDETIDCRSGGFELRNIEESFPLELSFDLINDGNVRLTPTVNIDIWDQLQENLVLSRQVRGDEILPTTQQKQFRSLTHNLGVGQYWANVELEECGTTGFLTFSISEPGSIVDNGHLRGLYNQPWIDLGQTIEVLAQFQNSGPRAVNAKFKGVIRKDDVIVKPVETDEVIVPPGDIHEFQVLFTPFDTGRYVLSGRVEYNKKLTFERATVFNVRLPGEEQKSNLIPLILYVIIIVTILFLLRRIWQLQRRRRRRFGF